MPHVSIEWYEEEIVRYHYEYRFSLVKEPTKEQAVKLIKKLDNSEKDAYRSSYSDLNDSEPTIENIIVKQNEHIKLEKELQRKQLKLKKLRDESSSLVQEINKLREKYYDRI